MSVSEAPACHFPHGDVEKRFVDRNAHVEYAG